MQTMITFSCIVSSQGALLDEEWGIVHNVVKQIAGNKSLMLQRGPVDCLQMVFMEIRNLWLRGQYHGPIDELFESYLLVKDIISDPSFDALYLNLVGKEASAATITKKVAEFLNVEVLFAVYMNAEDANRRAYSLLNSVTDFYQGLVAVDKQQAVENAVITRAHECKSLAHLSAANSLKCIQILHLMAKRTSSDDHFLMIVNTFGNETLVPHGGTVADSRKKQATAASRNEGSPTAAEALRNLFELFQENYLKAPPFRVLAVLRNFVEILQAKDKDS